MRILFGAWWVIMASTADVASAEKPKTVPTAEAVHVGMAHDAKGGAVVVGDGGEIVYVAGLGAWPEALRGRRLSLRGDLVVEAYLPQAKVDEKGAISQGAQGTQRVLRGGRWEIAPEKLPDGLRLRLGAPLTLSNGAVLALDGITHKQLVDGPVMGVWEFAARKGDAERRLRFVGEDLQGELDCFGVKVSLRALYDDVRVQLIEDAAPLADGAAALGLAKALAASFGLTANGSSQSETAGIYHVSLVDGGAALLSLRVGRESGRLWPGSFGLVGRGAAGASPSAP